MGTRLGIGIEMAATALEQGVGALGPAIGLRRAL
jgi:hypothetical protein